LGSSRRIVDAARAAHEHESTRELRAGEREMEHETRTHRVTEIRGAAASVGDQARAVVQPGSDGGGFAVARRVDAYDFVISREVGRYDAPAVAVLCEAVDENEARAATVDFRVEHVPHTCTKMGGWRTPP
jgi:hypothetical protein